VSSWAGAPVAPFAPAERRRLEGSLKARASFVWGLKRSGIHLVVNWLYANLGARVEGPLEADGLHAQLHHGFADAAARVGYFNNCGWLHSRRFGLGSLAAPDFDAAAHRYGAVIFGIEDCRLELAPRATVESAARVLVLRDPLNNLASRLEGAKTRPEVFRVDAPYVDLLDAYCAEFLGHTCELPNKTVVAFDRFVGDREYRDTIASALGVSNLDAVSDVPRFGGGSSFDPGADSAVAARPSPGELATRFRQHPIPGVILDQVLGKPAIAEVCRTVFGYDLAARAAWARAGDTGADLAVEG
jgi:hypothetical protein